MIFAAVTGRETTVKITFDAVFVLRAEFVTQPTIALPYKRHQLVIKVLRDIHMVATTAFAVIQNNIIH
jgi:hypothetical protein